MEPFYEKFDPDFLSVRTTVRQILQKEDDLNEIVQLVGKVGTSLSHLDMSRMVKLPDVSCQCSRKSFGLMLCWTTILHSAGCPIAIWGIVTQSSMCSGATNTGQIPLTPTIWICQLNNGGDRVFIRSASFCLDRLYKLPLAGLGH